MEVAVRELWLVPSGTVIEVVREADSIPASLVKILHTMALAHHKRHQDGMAEASCLHVLAESVKDLLWQGSGRSTT